MPQTIETNKRPTGRPPMYNQALVEVICSRIATGQSLREICRSKDMPSMTAVFNWLGKYPRFVEQYTRACAARSLYLAEEIIDIADDGTNDWVTRQNSDGEDYEVPNNEHIQRSRLRVDTRKWLLSKLMPKVYGDKITNEVTGPDGGPVEIREIELRIVKPNRTDITD
jgi:hypothetical protein